MARVKEKKVEFLGLIVEQLAVVVLVDSVYKQGINAMALLDSVQLS